MCGLFGYFGPGRLAPAERACQQALTAMAHRGPDASAILRRPELGLVLGHARLSIIDPLERSDQPFVSGDVSLVFNGEIYNYRHLRKELAALGASFVTNGDTEVIAEGYRRWGKGIFDKIRGMYAVALHDRRDGLLHLVRDDFGIKPLCYLERGGTVLFASEVKSIASMASLSIDPGVLTDLLSWGYQMENASLYAGIRYLSPGAVRTFRLDGDRLVDAGEQQLWTPGASYRKPALALSDEALRQVIDASVADHLVADVPVGLALSGGLDSSILAASAAELSPGLHAFTFTVAPGIDPEVEHASVLCRHLGLQHTVARMLPVDMRSWLRTVAWHLEEPVVNINALLGYCLAGVVQSHGMKVVLVGEGSDELFGGYPWYRYALDPKIGAHAEDVFDAYHARRAQAANWRTLRPDAQALGASRLRDQRSRFAMTVGSNQLDRFLNFDQATQLQYSQLLRVDRTFMAHGIEARVPFLYRPVHEASAGLSSARKLGPEGGPGRHEKIALAKAFEGKLPPSIANRPKFGQTGTVNLWDSWLTQGLAGEFERCISSDELRGARQMLDEYIDWRLVASSSLSHKQKFAYALLIEAVDAVLISKSMPDQSHAVAWQPA